MSVSLEELTGFLTQSTPRDPSPAILKAARKGGGGGVVIFGMIFLLAGVGLMYMLFPWRLHQSWQMSMSEPARIRGRITDAPDSNTSVNETKVYTVYFEFTTPNEEVIQGKSYSYGRHYSRHIKPTIEYLPSNPHIARIRGTYLNFIGWGGLFTLLGPLIGLVIFWSAINSRRKLKLLLREGRFAAGHVRRVSPTNVRINNQQQYRIEVAFETANGTEQIAEYKTTEDLEIDLAEAKKKTGDVAGVLYNPANPKHLLLVDTLLDIGDLQELFDEADALEKEEHTRERPAADRVRDALENAPGGLFGKLKAAYDEAKKVQDD